MENTKGKFIAIEAPDGCGKSTLIKALDKKLEMLGIPHITVKEPSTLEIGQFVRSWIKKTAFTNDKFLNTEALYLFAAQRIEFIENLIIPALQEGYLVLSDRFALSTAAYQDLNPNHKLTSTVQAVLNNLASFINVDATLFLELDPKIAMSRISGRTTNDPMDKGDLEFYTCLRVKYDILLSKYGNDTIPQSLKGEVIRLNAEQSPEKLCDDALMQILKIYGKNNENQNSV